MLRITQALQTISNVSSDTYAADSGDILPLNMGLTAVGRHLTISQSLLDDEARAWDEGVLEDLKRLRDCLVSVRDMFDRRERYDRDTIPALEKRIHGQRREAAERPCQAGTPGQARRGGTHRRGHLQGQVEHSRAACARRVRQGVSARRDYLLLVEHGVGFEVLDGLGGRAGQVCGVASRGAGER